MKKAFIFGLIAAALGFTACSSEDDLTVNDNNQKKGMVLRATVEQPAESRATFTDNEGTWQFAFTTGDVIKVTNKEIGADKFYTFTYDGEKFVSKDAVPTAVATTWYANFPSDKVSLVGQSGKWNDIANKYVMTGSTTDNVTGEEELSITMSPKVAILKIINKKGSIDINVKNNASSWVSGYKAEKGSIKDFYMLDPIVSDTKQTLLSTTAKGTYYVAVPAGQQLAVKNGDEVIKSTNTGGLQAGKYYELTVRWPTTGTAERTGNIDVNWVQLWENGPKFAEYNVGAENNRPEDYGGYYTWGGTYKNGKDIEYVKDQNTTYEGSGNLSDADDSATKLWGPNWRMPSKEELEALLNNDNCTCTWTTQNDVAGLLCTGKEGTDFASNSVFLPAAGIDYYGNIGNCGSDVEYWSSAYYGQNSAYILHFSSSERRVRAENRGIAKSIRPVLK